MALTFPTCFAFSDKGASVTISVSERSPLFLDSNQLTLCVFFTEMDAGRAGEMLSSPLLKEKQNVNFPEVHVQ